MAGGGSFLKKNSWGGRDVADENDAAACGLVLDRSWGNVAPFSPAGRKGGQGRGRARRCLLSNRWRHCAVQNRWRAVSRHYKAKQGERFQIGNNRGGIN